MDYKVTIQLKNAMTIEELESHIFNLLGEHSELVKTEIEFDTPQWRKLRRWTYRKDYDYRKKITMKTPLCEIISYHWWEDIERIFKIRVDQDTRNRMDTLEDVHNFLYG